MIPTALFAFGALCVGAFAYTARRRFKRMRFADRPMLRQRRKPYPSLEDYPEDHEGWSRLADAVAQPDPLVLRGSMAAWAPPEFWKHAKEN